ncbi:DUF4268 domain-containing protein [Flavihumibacter petaseus]|uniref:DUF4268 domain-containing protein n=1 Tax=Flavihumibacter petaseus NBRC 106054 TaxID=1220578 RepID=A0A0E9N0X9_9BACT|nr:DUF4268 domain-containing protein [Flavihumibacter petaseus]GAO43667.1 hypothetical protein FPE01S_02_07730 [Flavihumibacter petaseus NBRC 106054]
MYSKTALSEQKSRFFTALGRYMSPVPSAGGDPVNWMNYRTKLRHLHIRMELFPRNCRISFVLSGKDESERLTHYAMLESFLPVWEETCGSGWTWLRHDLTPEGAPCCRIFRLLENVSVMDDRHWPEMISFFKQHLQELDAFWQEVKDFFPLGN